MIFDVINLLYKAKVRNIGLQKLSTEEIEKFKKDIIKDDFLIHFLEEKIEAMLPDKKNLVFEKSLNLRSILYILGVEYSYEGIPLVFVHWEIGSFNEVIPFWYIWNC